MKISLLLVLWFATVPLAAFSQNDVYYGTSNSRYTTERFKRSVDTLPRQLIRVGLALPILRQSSFRGFYQTVAVNGLIEQKIGRLSLLFGLQANVGFARETQLFQLEMPLDVRYYFAIGRRMQQDGNRRSFYGYYLGVHTQNIIYSRLKYGRAPGFGSDIDRYERGQLLTRVVNNGLVHESFNFLQYAHLQVGRQCKVFERCFLDANVVVPISSLVYNKWDFTLATPAFASVTFGYRLNGK